MKDVYEEHNLLFTTYSTAESHATFLFENLAARIYKGLIYVYVQILWLCYICTCTDIIVMLYMYMYRYYSDVVYVYVQIL